MTKMPHIRHLLASLLRLLLPAAHLLLQVDQPVGSFSHVCKPKTRFAVLGRDVIFNYKNHLGKLMSTKKHSTCFQFSKENEGGQSSPKKLSWILWRGLGVWEPESLGGPGGPDRLPYETN